MEKYYQKEWEKLKCTVNSKSASNLFICPTVKVIKLSVPGRK